MLTNGIIWLIYGCMILIGLLVVVIVGQDVNGYIDLLNQNPSNHEAIDKIINLGSKVIPTIEKRIPDLPVPTKRSLVGILGKIQDSSATNILLELTKSDAALLRADVAHALGEIKDRRAVSRLTELLSDVHDAPRGEAAWALGEIGDESAIPALVSLTNDPVFTNRAKALIALGKLKGLSQINNFDRFLDDPEPTVRISLALAIGATLDTTYLDYLEKLSRDKEPFVRIQAYRILGKYSTETATSLLVAGLGDTHEGVRMQILESLVATKDPKLMPYIVSLKNDPSMSVRKRVTNLINHLDRQYLIEGMTEVIGTADLPLNLRRGALIYLKRNLDKEEAIRTLLIAFPFWTRGDAINVISRQIEKGMTKEQVSLSLGKPSLTKRDTIKGSEDWFYKKSGLKITFVDGRVVR